MIDADHIPGPSRAPRVSFEFFPPSTPAMETALWRALTRLEPLAPTFVSVTYGAGGSTRSRTHATVARIAQRTSLAAAAHLTCVGASRAEVLEIARGYRAAGVRHIVALRGDPPPMPDGGAPRFVPHPEGFRDAAELTAALHALGGFELTVAAHPEKHPDAPSVEADLSNLRRKVEAGASRAITQFSFEPDVFLRFRDRAWQAGVRVPLVPGILPVTNFAMMRGFAGRCGASVPGWLATRFEGLDAEPELRSLVAAAVAVEQCRALQREGVDQFHFYTLNRAELTTAICRVLGVAERARAAA